MLLINAMIFFDDVVQCILGEFAGLIPLFSAFFVIFSLPDIFLDFKKNFTNKLLKICSTIIVKLATGPVFDQIHMTLKFHVLVQNSVISV